jgi:hypothetical protein
VYLVLLELNGRPAGEYGDLERAIKALGNWSNRMRGMWMVETRFTAAQVRDLLFVQRMTTNWAGTNMGDGFSDWMARRKFV